MESGVESASALCQSRISLLFRISWQCLHNIYWSENQMFSSGQKSNCGMLTTTTGIILIQKLAFSNLGCGFYKIGFSSMNHVHIQPSFLLYSLPQPVLYLNKLNIAQLYFGKALKGFPSHCHLAGESNPVAWSNTKLWAGPSGWHFHSWSLGHTKRIRSIQPLLPH